MCTFLGLAELLHRPLHPTKTDVGIEQRIHLSDTWPQQSTEVRHVN
jgi:hypothetical protein